MWGAFGAAPAAGAVTFVSQRGLDGGVPGRVGTRRTFSPVRNCRAIGKRDMVHNDAMPHIEVDPTTYQVRADGELLTCEPADDAAARAAVRALLMHRRIERVLGNAARLPARRARARTASRCRATR